MQQKFKEGVCKQCNKLKLITNKSKQLCLHCNQIQSLKRTLARRNLKIQAGKVVDLSKMAKFYKEFWAVTPHYCFETNQPLYTYRAWHVHHLLEKKDYPQYALNNDVCVLLTLQQHALWHSLTDSDRAIKMPKTYKKYLEIKQKYNEY